MALLDEKESYEIRGACFWVWKEFGSAFKESIIDKALTEEFLRRGLKVDNQKRINVFYRDKKVGTYIPDKIINDSILIELKTKPFLVKADYLQFVRYLKGSSYKLGFLINFGNELVIKRYIYDEIRRAPRVLRGSTKLSVSSAFTLIELLITITIVAVLAVVGTINLFGYRSRLDLNNAGQEIAVTLKEAQNRSISQESTSTQGGGSRWGIHFENRATSTDYYDLFWGTTYSATNVASRTFLPTSVTFTNPPSGSSTDVIFAPVTGLAASTVITVAGNSQGSAVEDIIVSSNGKISSNLEEGIVGYWHLDEGSGTTSTDASGRGNNGTLTNGPTWQSGSNCKAGKCLSFDGTDDAVEKSSPSNLGLGPNATISAWIKANTITGGSSCNSHNGSGACRIILFNHDWGYFLGVNSDGAIDFDTSGDGTSWTNITNTPAGAITTGSWYHITVVAQNNSTIAYYINGSLLYTASVANTMMTNRSTLCIGGCSAGVWNGGKFNGLIDEVRVYNRALTATEIANQYNALK